MLKNRLNASSCAKFVLGAVGLGLLAPGIANAQGATSGDIIVTAQKREEKLQEVPIAITAVRGDDLLNRANATISGIQQVAPSLNVATYPNSSDTVALNMRGQGMADAGQITKDGGVGLYIDGFYISRPQAALLDLGSPERVEVLRGPQGTLYGRNTTGGAINIITKKPTGKWGGEGSVSYGSRDYVRTMADINLPAFNNFAVKGTLLYMDKDGWVKNPGAKHNYGESGQLAGRLAVEWTPTDNLSFNYAWDKGRVTSTQPYYSNPDLVGFVPGYTADKDRTYAPLDIGTSYANFQDHQLTVEWDASDNLLIRSLTGYRDFSAFQDVNYGYAQSLPGLLGLEVAQQHDYGSDQFSQEFQFVGSFGDRVDYTAGLYYFNEDSAHLQLQQSNIVITPGAPFFPPAGLYPTTRLVAAKSTSKAVYAQVTITPPILDDRMKLTLGGRYTEDERSATRDRYFAIFPLELGARNKQKFDDFSPSANLSMQWTPDIMTFAKYSQAYKAGGSSEGGQVFSATYEPEEVKSYEIGAKTQFFDRMLTLNGSIFYNEYDKLQIDFVENPADLTVVSTVNAGAANVKGAEFEVTIQPNDRFTLSASYAYLDAELESVRAPAGTAFDPAVNPFSPVAVGADVTDYFTLAFIPEHSASVSADFRIFDQDDRSLTAYANYSYQSGVYSSSVAGPGVPGRNSWLTGDQNLVNTRLSWRQPMASGANLTLSAFANNLLDERFKTFVIGIGSNLSGYFSTTSPYNEPRTIGVEAKVTF